jgi:hypothetical protein
MCAASYPLGAQCKRYRISWELLPTTATRRSPRAQVRRYRISREPRCHNETSPLGSTANSGGGPLGSTLAPRLGRIPPRHGRTGQMPDSPHAAPLGAGGRWRLPADLTRRPDTNSAGAAARIVASVDPLVSLRREGTAKDEGTGEFMPGGGYRAS